MAHNYAKPLTEEARLARVMHRLPDDWGISIDRPASGGWTVRVTRPDGAGFETLACASFAEALEEAWRAARS